jgi:hypothetical protein
MTNKRTGLTGLRRNPTFDGLAEFATSIERGSRVLKCNGLVVGMIADCKIASHPAGCRFRISFDTPRSQNVRSGDTEIR